ncbi:contact-dependent growth inhibition system immunity protein [Enterobacter cloacae]|uniref:contact-dependent growth inhibition system immunity protein n=1 Tax=Enterobacter cloacae TaxID=550 RepID=UPI000F6702E0|nr:contact-dependent growth inhibition system immunity protein [Enterobacter cloacae]
MFSRLTHIWDKNPARKYPLVQDMLTIYFSNEHDDFGSTLIEIISNYRCYNASSLTDAKSEINSLLDIADEQELIATMEKIAENRFHPAPWGETWRSFLEKVRHYL